MASGSRCSHTSGKTFFRFLQPISCFGPYLGNKNRPSGTFPLGMPHVTLFMGDEVSNIFSSNNFFEKATFSEKMAKNNFWETRTLLGGGGWGELILCQKLI